jgi:hyperosmotically inducible protein
MNGSFLKLPGLLLPLALVAFCVLLTAALVPAYQHMQQPAPDNTRNNKEQTLPTADQQKMNPADRAITQKIRKAIHQDKGLSSYAHNIKIITQDGRVTLRGPVRSENEKGNLQAKAAAVAGEENVTNQLEVTPSNN